MFTTTKLRKDLNRSDIQISAIKDNLLPRSNVPCQNLKYKLGIHFILIL